jgi:cyclophilin family peptidyl-prolyl cis-trans isomerase
VARIARLSLIPLVVALAACGGGSKTTGSPSTKKACDIRGSDTTFPLLSPKRPHSVGVVTNLGSFEIRLDVAHSPCVTSSFAALVRRNFFDGTVFHRIVPDFVIQGGDPSGTGTGGPGYTVVEAPPPGSTYTEGIVAMAKTGDEPPGAAGCQFFVVTAKDAGLPPEYAIPGKVSKGLNVVRRIGALGNPATEKPTRRVVVLRMTVT